MADDFVKKSVKKQLFGEKEGRRSVNSPRRGPERRKSDSAWPKATEDAVLKNQPGAAVSGRRLGTRMGGRRHTDLRDTPRLAERDLRVAATGGSDALGAKERGTIVSTPVIRPKAASTIGSSSGILRKTGRLGKIAAAGIAAYGAYKAWRSE